MMSAEIDDKTEQPTERRRRLAREQGQGPRSSDLTIACRLLGVAAGFQFFGGQLVRDCAQLLTTSLQRPLRNELTVVMVTSQGWEAATQIGLSALGCGACVLIAGLAAQLFQVGLHFRVEELRPDLSRLGPARAWLRLWSFESTTQAILALMKYLLVIGIGGWGLWSRLGGLSFLVESDVSTMAGVIGSSVVSLAWQLAAIYLVIGLADYGYQMWKFEQSLKMTPAEIREEARLQSGDPQWKQRRRDVWRQLHSSPSTSPDSQTSPLPT